MAKKVKYVISSYLGDNILESNIVVSKKAFEYSLKQCQHQASSHNAICEKYDNVEVNTETVNHIGYKEYISKYIFGSSAFYFRKLVADDGLKFRS